MQNAANQFATDYMKLCDAAHHYARLTDDDTTDKKVLVPAEDAYLMSLQVCLESAQNAFPGRGRVNLFLALSKVIDEAKLNDKPLAEFKTEHFRRIMNEIDALPQQPISNVHGVQKSEPADEIAR